MPWPDWSVSDPQGDAPPSSATSSSQRRRQRGKLSERAKNKIGWGFNQEQEKKSFKDRKQLLFDITDYITISIQFS